MNASCEFSTCPAASEAAPERGTALLQAQQIKRHAKFSDDAVKDELPEEVLLKIDMASEGIGSTATLDEAGYQKVAALCCNKEMIVFARRLVESLGLELCDIGGLMGMVIWYTCDPSDPIDHRSSFDALKSNLLASQPPKKCAFVASSGKCPAKNPSCKGVIDASRVSDCKAVPTTVTTDAPRNATTTVPPTTTTTTTTTFGCPGYCPNGKAMKGQCKDNYMDACVYSGCIGGGLTNAGKKSDTAKTVQDCHQACVDEPACTWFKFSLGGKSYSWGPLCFIVSDIPWNGTETKGPGIYKFDTKYTHYISCALDRNA